MTETIAKSVVLGGMNEIDSNKLPLVATPVRACFSLGANEHSETPLVLVEHLVSNPSTTYYMRVVGDSMIGLGIYSSDLLIVDRSLEPKHEDIIVISVNGELLCKRLEFINGSPYLIPANANYLPVSLNETEYYIWGVVTYNIHSLKNKG